MDCHLQEENMNSKIEKKNRMLSIFMKNCE